MSFVHVVSCVVPVSHCTLSVHFVQIEQRLAEIICTVLYLNICFLSDWVGFDLMLHFFMKQPLSPCCTDEFLVLYSPVCSSMRWLFTVPYFCFRRPLPSVVRNSITLKSLSGDAMGTGHKLNGHSKLMRSSLMIFNVWGSTPNKCGKYDETKVCT